TTGMTRSVFAWYSPHPGSASTVPGLDRHLGVRPQVVEPGGVERRSGGGGDHQDAAALVRQVRERHRVRPTGTRTGRGQQDQPGVGEHATDAAPVRAELVDDGTVEVVQSSLLFLVKTAGQDGATAERRNADAIVPG